METVRAVIVQSIYLDFILFWESLEYLQKTGKTENPVILSVSF